MPEVQFKSPKTWAYVFAGGMLAINLAAPLLFSARVGRADWDQFLTFHLIQDWNRYYFGPAKQWDPLLGGGMSLGGDPQVPVMSLTMLLGYLAGPLAGLRIGTMVWSLIGFIGAYLFAGVSCRETPVRILAAGLFVGNGFFITHIGNGHVCHLPAFAVPLFLWAIHRADQRIAALDARTDQATTVILRNCNKINFTFRVFFAIIKAWKNMPLRNGLSFCGLFWTNDGVGFWSRRRPRPWAGAGPALSLGPPGFRG